MEPPSRLPLPRAQSHTHLRTASTSTLPIPSRTNDKIPGSISTTLLRKPSKILQAPRLPHPQPIQKPSPLKRTIQFEAPDSPTPIKILRHVSSSRELSNASTRTLKPSRSMMNLPKSKPDQPSYRQPQESKQAQVTKSNTLTGAINTTCKSLAGGVKSNNLPKPPQSKNVVPLASTRTVSSISTKSTSTQAKPNPTSSTSSITRKPSQSTLMTRKPSISTLGSQLASKTTTSITGKKPSDVVVVSVCNKIKSSDHDEIRNDEDDKLNVAQVTTSVAGGIGILPTPKSVLRKPSMRSINQFAETPSPMKRAHSISDTPLFPRIASYNSNGKSLIGPLVQLDTIADTSFSFEAEGNSTRLERSSNDPPKGEIGMKEALKATEMALERMRIERDTARRSEEVMKSAMKRKEWEGIVEAIQVELDRNQEYIQTLRILKKVIMEMPRSN